MKSSSKQIENSRMTSVLGLLAVVAVLGLVAACGGNSSTSDTVAIAKDVIISADTPTPSELVGKKNAGGITYTAGVNLLDPVADKDADNDGIPDRVANYISAVYTGTDASTTAKVEALIADAREYTSVLSLPYSNLPKTKTEAAKIIYTESAFKNYCIFTRVFSITELGSAAREMLLLNLNSALKVQRYREIERLADYQSLSRDCK